MQKVETIEKVAKLLAVGNINLAKKVIRSEYSFSPVKREDRKYTIRESMEQFCKDGFIDRYSGKKLINPGMLRVLSVKMPVEFPYQAHWKMDECHIAYWDLQPTVDHIYPIALGGVDSPENWASTSMINNSAKGNFALEQLGWSLKPAGKLSDWDGLSDKFIEIVQKDPSLLEVKKIRDWYSATKEVVKKYQEIENIRL